MRPLARPSIPRRTVRLRLTLVYGALFLVCGAALLAFTYVLVAHATNRVLFYNSGNGLSGAVVGKPSKSARPGLVSTQVNGTPGASAPPDIDRLRALAERQHAAELHQLLLQSGIALAVMAVISIGLGWLVAGRVLRPLRTITTAVRDISATNLHQRLALSGPDDELKELGNTFDALLARLDASFQGQRRFVANASHELRTPLARQRTLAQVALDDPRATVESLRAAHERVLAAGTQQERLIEALLTLARTEAGLHRRQPVDLAVVTARVLADLRPEAQLQGLHLDATLEPAPTSGDPRLIERLVTNLADNALRHNIDEGSVQIRTGVTDGAAVLCVINTGPVVPAPDVDRLFQPFQRIGAERTGHGNGVGLGLSIVQAVADTHDAGIVAAACPDGGLRVEVTFALRDDHTATAAQLAPVGAAAAE
jgi:signal transduction histidine kinase